MSQNQLPTETAEVMDMSVVVCGGSSRCGEDGGPGWDVPRLIRLLLLKPSRPFHVRVSTQVAKSSDYFFFKKR